MHNIKRITHDELAELLETSDPSGSVDLGAVSLHTVVVDGKQHLVVENPADNDASALITFVA